VNEMARAVSASSFDQCVHSPLVDFSPVLKENHTPFILIWIVHAAHLGLQALPLAQFGPVTPPPHPCLLAPVAVVVAALRAVVVAVHPLLQPQQPPPRCVTTRSDV
jgi:hypothetical protein